MHLVASLAVWVRDAEGVETRAIAELVELNRKRVLDVGCGRGRLTEFAASRAAEVFAFDPDEEAVAHARKALPAEFAGRVAYMVGSGTEVEIPRSAFDIVVFSWSL